MIKSRVTDNNIRQLEDEIKLSNKIILDGKFLERQPLSPWRGWWSAKEVDHPVSGGALCVCRTNAGGAY